MIGKRKAPVVRIDTEAIAKLLKEGRIDILDSGQAPVMTLELNVSRIEGEFWEWLTSPEGRRRLIERMTAFYNRGD